MASEAQQAGRPFWEIAYAAVLALVDAVAITLAALLALTVRFGSRAPELTGAIRTSSHTISYSTFVALLTPLWVAVIAASKAYEPRLLGVGAEEFKRLVNASVRFVALIAFVSFAFKAQVARGFVAVVVPAGLAFLLAGRYGSRKVLHNLRRRGACLHRVVAVGSAEEIRALTLHVQREPYAGLLVVAVAQPDFSTDSLQVGDQLLPDIGPARDLARRLAEVSADTVAVAGMSAMSSRELRQLSWDLEGTGADLIVAPAITDVTGPRIHVRPVAGLPLLHLEAPRFSGVPRAIKRVIDVVGALVLLIVLSLPLLAIVVLIRRDGGPAIFRQFRVGRDNHRFRILKFRSMREGAEDELPALSNERDGPMFKMAADPRVTRVGAWLRSLSLDELPQLVNVLGGSMSLVGPRPPLPSEVEGYDDHVHRRLLVKPGMTGLWQVSGRADLPWEESVRLDLYYVENWSVLLDIQILWKTMFAVAKRSGAY